jgi:hypothetical protein
LLGTKKKLFCAIILSAMDPINLSGLRDKIQELDAADLQRAEFIGQDKTKF